MKKMLSLLTALMMLCALLPAMAEGTDVTGLWYLSALKMGETEMNPATMGLDLAFDLKEDGTALASMGGAESTEEQTASWALKEDGTLVISQDGTDTVFTVSDGRLEGDIGGGTIGVFTREPAAAAVKPAPVAAESEDAFLGSWKLTQVDMDGILLPVDMLATMGMEISASLTVEASKASIVLTFFGTELPVIEGATAFSDGALAMTVEGLEQPIAISLCDSGELYAVISVPSLGSSMPMYFAHAE